MVMRFGTWNVRILLQAGNMNIIAEEADHGRNGLQALKKMCK
jgi:hypothetical protein